MIRAIFAQDGALLTGFTIGGHADTGRKRTATDEQMHVLCAAVSSAAELVANTLTECMQAKAEITQSPSSHNRVNRLTLRLVRPDVQQSTLLRGLLLHFQTLAEEYPDALCVSVHTNA